MGGDSVHSNSKDKDVSGEQAMTNAELIQKVTDLCVSSGLSYNGVSPTAVSPGVWMFYAVECSRMGHCRQLPRFAALIGERLVLA